MELEISAVKYYDNAGPGHNWSPHSDKFLAPAPGCGGHLMETSHVTRDTARCVTGPGQSAAPGVTIATISPADQTVSENWAATGWCGAATATGCSSSDPIVFPELCRGLVSSLVRRWDNVGQRWDSVIICLGRAGLMEQIAIQIQTTQHALLLQWWRYSCVNASINMWSCEDNVNHKWAVWLASKTFGEGRVLSTFRWQLYCLAMSVFCVHVERLRASLELPQVSRRYGTF